MARVASDEIRVLDGQLVGPLRRSVNQAQGVRDSIHNDAVASKLGFRGGTVAGSIHLELFPPLLLQAFGDKWLERGTLSVNFRNPTTDREPVRAYVTQPSVDGDTQVDVRVEREDGLLVGEGTASVGDATEPSALLQLDLDRFEPGELRILAGVSGGDPIPEADMAMPAEVQTARMDVITEPLEWYTDSPWGGPIASPATIVHFLYAHPARVLGKNAGRAVGLFGAIETRQVNGPLVLDRSYRVGGEIVAVGQSPKTEYVWFESYANAEDGTRVAEMRMQLRWMKESSPLYATQ
ncbi:MAG: hypothetical protein WD826_06570 [Actinomycetota bacterium]